MEKLVIIMNIEVHCYSGYRGEETPRSFRIGSNNIEVIEILDRWLAPDHRYFKILGTDYSIYILRHDVQEWTWDLTYFSKLSTPCHMDDPIGVS